jgi:hypothetical protein
MFIESESKRAEMTLYILPRFFQAIWNFLKRRNLVIDIPHLEVIVFGFSMGIINHFYINN